MKLKNFTWIYLDTLVNHLQDQILQDTSEDKSNFVVIYSGGVYGVYHQPTKTFCTLNDHIRYSQVLRHHTGPGSFAEYFDVFKDVHTRGSFETILQLMATSYPVNIPDAPSLPSDFISSNYDDGCNSTMYGINLSDLTKDELISLLGWLSKSDSFFQTRPFMDRRELIKIELPVLKSIKF